jgi:hypothetical protein
LRSDDDVREQKNVRFQGWRFSQGTNAALEFVDADGRTDVLELTPDVQRHRPARIHQTLPTIPGCDSQRSTPRSTDKNAPPPPCAGSTPQIDSTRKRSHQRLRTPQCVAACAVSSGV